MAPHLHSTSATETRTAGTRVGHGRGLCGERVCGRDGIREGGRGGVRGDGRGNRAGKALREGDRSFWIAATGMLKGFWLPDMDLNHDKQIQSLLCYRYTIGQSVGA